MTCAMEIKLACAGTYMHFCKIKTTGFNFCFLVGQTNLSRFTTKYGNMKAFEGLYITQYSTTQARALVVEVPHISTIDVSTQVNVYAANQTFYVDPRERGEDQVIVSVTSTTPKHWIAGMLSAKRVKHNQNCYK